ncbi:DUF1307 domain-containing protein [Oceanobacillus neutriphilus]|uniref:DUF1307 domain-containing protein n=1 Tax=Oceanobacillus neutriphilus TaxID=531815 RepID=A0ABQ2P2L9_9BACI|nr:DUF1307 domain-containing protein [Oceanobacillus neutriphilus]GGP16617.1 hypothetical protein GCM10011346_49250 [Oceanobacillus neutriphilus]
MSKKMTKTKTIGFIIALVIILGLVIFVWLKPSYPTDGTVILSADQDEVTTTVTIEAENGRVQTVKYENMMYYSDLGTDGTTREAMESQHDTNMEQYAELNAVDGLETGYIYEDDRFIVKSYFDFTEADLQDIIEIDAAVSDKDDLKTENYMKHLEEIGLEME